MQSLTLLGIKINPQSREYVLEKIKKYIVDPQANLHIVSLNPENLVIARENPQFKKIIETAQIQIADGVGVVLAAKMQGVRLDRITGVDLMKSLLKLADELSLRVLLIGGKGNLANDLVECYSETYARSQFQGIQGIKNISNPLKSDENKLFSIVTAYKPHLIFAAFGSPEQELWLDRHKEKFVGSVMMGVGGAFDFLSGKIKRAPRFVRVIGLEWLFRLIIQPWRWRRQLKLLKFAVLVISEKISPLKLS